jgi:hypothetical protein
LTPVIPSEIALAAVHTPVAVAPPGSAPAMAVRTFERAFEAAVLAVRDAAPDVEEPPDVSHAAEAATVAAGTAAVRSVRMC